VNTFNASGLSEQTIENFGLAGADPDSLIFAHFLLGDTRSLAQDLSPPPNAPGNRLFVIPRGPHTAIGVLFIDTTIESLPESQ
jgi:hypothetical protein